MAEGVNTSLAGLAKIRVADFVHGTDGLGNTNQPTARVGFLQLRQAAATHEARLSPGVSERIWWWVTWPSAAGEKFVEAQHGHSQCTLC